MSLKNNIKSLVWADYIAAMITDPRLFAVKISSLRRKLLFSSFLTVFIAVFSVILSVLRLSGQNEYFYYKITYGLLLSFIIVEIIIFIYSLFTDFILQFLGYEGRAAAVISAFNYSMFPFVFVLPCTAVFSSLNFAAPVFFVVFMIAAAVYSCYFMILFLSESGSVKIMHCIVAIGLPVVITGIVCLVSLTAFAGLVYGFITNL